jgi:hypothetical protein
VPESLPIFTIGHSTRSIPEFVDLLRVGQVERIVDIRTVPRSRTNPAYNLDRLPAELRAYGIAHTQIAELGGLRKKSKTIPPEANGYWVNRSFHNYADYALSDEFRSGMERLVDLAAGCRVAIMCSEAVWWRCHRRIVADYLLQAGKHVLHLMGSDRAVPAVMNEAARVGWGGLVYPGAERWLTVARRGPMSGRSCNAAPDPCETAIIRASSSQAPDPGLSRQGRTSPGPIQHSRRSIGRTAPSGRCGRSPTRLMKSEPMTTTDNETAPRRPPIHLIDAEYDIIADLALGIARQWPELSRMLLDEIDRAEIHAPDALPADVVTIGSEVEVLDGLTGATRQLRLVLPGEVDVDAGRVSVLTPIGAALIGLRKGQSIEWPYRTGETRMLKILKVMRPTPE